MWAALWEPLLLLKTAGNGKVRRVLATAGWIWRFAEWVHNTGYSHGERERENHDSLTIKVRDGGRNSRAVGSQQQHNRSKKSSRHSHVILKAMNVGFPGFPYCTQLSSQCCIAHADTLPIIMRYPDALRIRARPSWAFSRCRKYPTAPSRIDRSILQFPPKSTKVSS